MRVPPNKRHLVVNKEYSRLPYWTDDGFEDVQRQTSQKYVQDNYGNFPESENQQPYKGYNGDEELDYQALEYNFSLPQFNIDPIDINNFKNKDINCYEYWNQLFPTHRDGAFIPNHNERNLLNTYSQICPIEYVEKICCRRGIRVQGPVNNTLESGESYTFTLTTKVGKDCRYEFWAEKGRMLSSGDYTAPNTDVEIEDHMGVSPWLSGDSGEDCLKWTVKIKPKTECKGTVHATTPQMSTGASQTLYITGGSEGDTYYWSTTTGSLSSPTGTSVVYTAPATNPNCALNPTITVTCGGAVIGKVTIAVNAKLSTGYAYYIATGGSYRECEAHIITTVYNCSGQTYGYPRGCAGCDASVQAPNCVMAGGEECTIEGMLARCIRTNGCGTVNYGDGPIILGCSGVTDVRTAYDKQIGCCPAALL